MSPIGAHAPVIYDSALVGRGSAAQEIWRHRELLRRLVARNLKMRYQRTVLGFFWALLNPLLTIMILVGVFHYVVRIGVTGYWAFLVSGYFGWVFTQHTLGTSAAIVTEHSYMTRSLAFPSEVLVLGSALSRLIEFVAELVLVVVVLAIFHHGGVPASVVALPLIVVLHVLVTVGLALPIAAASVFFKDVQHAVPVALTLIGYLSLVFFPASMVPQPFRTVLLLNPVAALLTLYHAVLYEGRFPSAERLGLAALLAVVAWVVGLALFRRKRGLFAEIV